MPFNRTSMVCMKNTFIIYKCEIAEEAGVCQSLEGPVDYEKDAIIMTGINNEQWPMGRRKFDNSYHVLEKSKEGKVLYAHFVLFEPKKFIIAEAKTKVQPEWSKIPFWAEKGDAIIIHGPGDEMICEKSIFFKTYLTAENKEALFKLQLEMDFETAKKYNVRNNDETIYQEIFNRNFDKIKSYLKQNYDEENSISASAHALQQARVTKFSEVKQAPTSTEMNWDLFDTTNDIPQALSAPTSTSFEETKIASSFKKTLQIEEINNALQEENIQAAKYLSQSKVKSLPSLPN